MGHGVVIPKDVICMTMATCISIRTPKEVPYPIFGASAGMVINIFHAYILSNLNINGFMMVSIDIFPSL